MLDDEAQMRVEREQFIDISVTSILVFTASLTLTSSPRASKLASSSSAGQEVLPLSCLLRLHYR
jgi:hypothetical protein